MSRSENCNPVRRKLVFRRSDWDLVNAPTTLGQPHRYDWIALLVNKKSHPL